MPAPQVVHKDFTQNPTPLGCSKGTVNPTPYTVKSLHTARQEGEALAPELAAAAERLARAQQRHAEEAARRWRPPDAVTQKLARAVRGAFDTACAELKAQHATLRNMEQNNAYTLIHKCAPHHPRPPLPALASPLP